MADHCYAAKVLVIFEVIYKKPLARAIMKASHTSDKSDSWVFNEFPAWVTIYFKQSKLEAFSINYRER